ncbi:hypothetical protein JW905_07660 [bacterium]|nr:hypothetical protein [candidate division CSSED10-310 bacterium]
MTGPTRHEYQVTIEPVDPLLFGDNRLARAGADAFQEDQDPSPLTIFGAIGGHLLDGKMPVDRNHPQLGRIRKDIFDGEGETAELLGYALRDEYGNSWFPMPRHYRMRDGRIPRHWEYLVPHMDEHDPVRSSCPCRYRLIEPSAGEEYEKSVLISDALLGAILTGGTPEISELDLKPFCDIYLSEPRMGLRMLNDLNTAEEHMLFTRPYRRFNGGVTGDHGRYSSCGFVAWMRLLAPLDPPGPPDSHGYLGGDRRRIMLTYQPDPNIMNDMKKKILGAVAGAAGFLLYLLTPAVVTGRDYQPYGQPPVAAALGKPACCSGWNMGGNHPRPILNLAPAGSVFFYEWPDGRTREETIDEQWFACIGQRYGAAGFGRVIPGVWYNESENR